MKSLIAQATLVRLLLATGSDPLWVLCTVPFVRYGASCRDGVGLTGGERCAAPCRHIVTKLACCEAETANTHARYVRVYICQTCGTWLDDDTVSGRLKIMKDPRCQR